MKKSSGNIRKSLTLSIKSDIFQAGRQAGRQASRQASRQAGKQRCARNSVRFGKALSISYAGRSP